MTLICTGGIRSDAFYRHLNAEVGRRSIGKLLGRLALRLRQEFVLGTTGIVASSGEDERCNESFEEDDHANAYDVVMASVTTFGMAVVLLDNPLWR